MSEPGGAPGPDLPFVVTQLLEDLRAVDGELMAIHQRGEAASRASFRAAQTLETVRRAVTAGTEVDAISLVAAVVSVELEVKEASVAMKNLGKLVGRLPIRWVAP